MKIMQTLQRNTMLGGKLTLVMAERDNGSITCFSCDGHVTAAEAAFRGQAMTEREACLAGFAIPDGAPYVARSARR